MTDPSALMSDREAMRQRIAELEARLVWRDISTAPLDTGIQLYDGFSVVVGAKQSIQSFEDWWETVGSEDEPEDRDGYADYVEDTDIGWIGHEAISGDELSLEPTHWLPLSTPPSDRTTP